jgi:predicted nucleic acid-binding Zn ribbon protein
MKRDPKPLQELMERALGRPELVNQVRARRVYEKWSEIVGETLAKKCAPSRYEAGTIWITVSGASWAQELRMHKRELLEKLNEHDGIFKELRFVVGKIETPSDKSDERKVNQIEPEKVDVEFHVPEIEEVGRRALGKMKAVSKKGNVGAD